VNSRRRDHKKTEDEKEAKKRMKEFEKAFRKEGRSNIFNLS